MAHLILVTCTTAKRYLNLATKQHYIHPTHCKPIDSGCIAHKEINTDATRKKRRKKHVWTLGSAKYSKLACLHLDHHFALRNSVNVVMKHAAITEATTCLLHGHCKISGLRLLACHAHTRPSLYKILPLQYKASDTVEVNCKLQILNSITHHSVVITCSLHEIVTDSSQCQFSSG